MDDFDEEVRDKIRNYSDEELLRMMNGNPEDYTPFAWKIGREELLSRGGKDTLIQNIEKAVIRDSSDEELLIETFNENVYTSSRLDSVNKELKRRGGKAAIIETAYKKHFEKPYGKIKGLLIFYSILWIFTLTAALIILNRDRSDKLGIFVLLGLLICVFTSRSVLKRIFALKNNFNVKFGFFFSVLLITTLWIPFFNLILLRVVYGLIHRELDFAL